VLLWALVMWEGLGSPGERMPLRPHRPCDGKGSGNAHDEEELYFHCELSVPHRPLSLAPSQLPPPVIPAMSPLPSVLLSLPLFSVKVPTRRTFLDPQSCGDPLQAVHLFAKELDAKSVTLEKSLGAGKPWTPEAWIHQGAPHTG
jgi:hypothetical protein